MNIVGYGGKTYLYINGLKVISDVKIDSRITLLPASLPPNPSSYYEAAKSEFDLGMIMLYRHTIFSQLEIVESKPEDLAYYAANALWDLSIISALFDCEAECTFQCNHSANVLNKDSDLLVTNYNLYGLKAPVYEMTDVDTNFLVSNIETARNLLTHDCFRNAVHCLWSYRWHLMPSVQLAILWSGIESLFCVDSEMTFRISLYIAKYLEPSNSNAAQELFREVKNLYGARSRAVHGSKIKNDANGATSVKKSAEILRKLIKKCVIANGIPNTVAILF